MAVVLVITQPLDLLARSAQDYQLASRGVFEAWRFVRERRFNESTRSSAVCGRDRWLGHLNVEEERCCTDRAQSFVGLIVLAPRGWIRA